MSKQESIQVEGNVIETLPNASFRVQLENDHVILAHISRECNTLECARTTMQAGLHSVGAGELRVVDSYWNEPNEIVTLGG